MNYQKLNCSVYCIEIYFLRENCCFLQIIRVSVYCYKIKQGQPLYDTTLGAIFESTSNERAEINN